MKIISVINYKGGVGKTTITANLGAELAKREKRVLLIDLDAQSSLTFSLIAPDQWKKEFSEKRTIKTWFDSHEDGLPEPLVNLIFTPKKANKSLTNGCLDLIPSHLGLINVDLELATELKGASLKKTKKNYLKVHQRLAKGLEQISSRAYDFILIDCPPNFNIVTKTAIVASEHILIPAKPDYLSTLGIDYLHRSLRELVEEFNEYSKIDNPEPYSIHPRILGVIFTMVSYHSGQPISASRQFISQTKRLGIPVFENMVRENKTLHSEAPVYGVPVVLTSQPKGTYGNIVEELRNIATEFLQRLGMNNER